MLHRVNPEDPEYQRINAANAYGAALLEKHKIPLIKLLVNVPQVFPTNFLDYPWTFPYEYQSFNHYKQNVNRKCRYITFKVGTTYMPTKVEFEFDILGYDKERSITIEFEKIKRYLERSEYSEIMRLLVGFPLNDKELTKEIGFFSPDLNGGSCDITNMLFNEDTSKWKTINSYFPIYSSADNNFWVSAKAINFYRLWDSQRKLERERRERRERRQAYKRRILPSGVMINNTSIPKFKF